MKKIVLFLFFFMTSMGTFSMNPINGLLERIDKGASNKFIIEQVNSEKDFFELDYKDDKVVIRGNNYVSIATGINWYLKYYAHIQLCWNNMTAKLPKVLPLINKKERHETVLKYRYDFNYCTYSYTMVFWDWNRWEHEIDWMALHGINLPLCIVGTGSVWRNMLLKLGYSKEEINQFVAGPAFQAWWLMNNLEGWGGPNPDSWYKNQEMLQKQILKRMKEFGMKPILPGYSGMLPSNAKSKLGMNVSDPGRWNGYHRPAFLQPTDKNFSKIAQLYYSEITKLYGKADFYSMDPFHEGGSTKDVDLEAAGNALWKEMKKINPKSTWVAQAWGQCPYDKMIRNLPKGDLLVLDLYSESRPQWGDSESAWYREKGFGHHNWLYCMLLNFGGNIGLFGRMQHVIEEFYKAKESPFSATLKGVGMTMEGTENNPVMYELLCELPWRNNSFSKDEWLKDYIMSRYGKSSKDIYEAWILLSNTIYNCPNESAQQGTHESIFCAYPSLNAFQVSSWSKMKDYYQPMDVINAAGQFLMAAESFRGNNNYEYDLVDIVRQAIAEEGRLTYYIVKAAYNAHDKKLFEKASQKFLKLIILQDKLLATRPEFKVGKWINYAKAMGNTKEEKSLYEWNARVQITTWGNRMASEDGGLHDYAHKEWNGLLKDYYYVRWKLYFDELTNRLNGIQSKDIDYYALGEKWVHDTNAYSDIAEGDVIDVAKEAYNELSKSIYQ